MLEPRCSPARGRGDRDLHQSLLPRSSLRLRDNSSRNEERGHPPFLRQPAAVLVARNVVVPRPLLRRGGSLAAGVDDPTAANGVRFSPADPSQHGFVEARCVLLIALVALVVLAPLASARGSGGGHGHVNAAGGSSRAEALPLERANAADGSRAAGRQQQRHPNSRGSEEEEDEGDEDMERQAEVDQEGIEEKQGEQQKEEQHEGHDDDGDDWRRRRRRLEEAAQTATTRMMAMPAPAGQR